MDLGQGRYYGFPTRHIQVQCFCQALYSINFPEYIDCTDLVLLYLFTVAVFRCYMPAFSNWSGNLWYVREVRPRAAEPRGPPLCYGPITQIAY